MDAIWHGIITAGLFPSPLAIVASAVNLRYTRAGIEELRKTLPSEHISLCHGITSHIEANKFSYWNEKFKRMRGQTAQALSENGVPPRFSEPAMEATVDFLLLEEGHIRQWAKEIWDQCDWNVLLEFAPQFSREPERASHNIQYTRERIHHPDIDHTAKWLQRVIEHLTTTQPNSESCLGAVKSIAEILRLEKLYHEVTKEIREAVSLEILEPENQCTPLKDPPG